MKILSTIFLTVVALQISAQIDVTFQVDMSGQSISPDGVHIAGSLNGWNTSANMLTDPDGDDIYTITINLAADADFEYKYLNGNAWGTEETPPMACAVGGNNRIFTSSPSNMILPVVPFSGCPSPNPTQEVTFTVDMSGETVSGSGVYLAGNFNGWNPTSTQMTAIGNDFYQVTMTVLSVLTTVQYKYLNGSGWGNEESIPSPCVNGNSNREFVIDGLGNTVDLPAFEFGTCNQSAIILPVVLTSFVGRAVDQNTILKWGTSSEVNNKGFEVEHSQDAREWEMVDFVQGHGDGSSVQKYESVHTSSIVGINYYRLKQIDFDGQYEYSDVIAVDIQSKTGSVKVFPNPVIDELVISNAQGSITIYNMIGRPVRQEQINENQYTLDLSSLSPGNYVVAVAKKDGSTFTTTIIK